MGTEARFARPLVGTPGMTPMTPMTAYDGIFLIDPTTRMRAQVKSHIGKMPSYAVMVSCRKGDRARRAFPASPLPLIIRVIAHEANCEP